MLFYMAQVMEDGKLRHLIGHFAGMTPSDLCVYTWVHWETYTLYPRIVTDSFQVEVYGGPVTVFLSPPPGLFDWVDEELVRHFFPCCR